MSSSSAGGGTPDGPGNRKKRSFLATPPTAKKAKPAGIVAEIYNCRGALNDGAGKIEKGKGPPTGKNIISIFTGLAEAENAALAAKIAAAFPHGKTETAPPFSKQSQFPGGAPLCKPSKVTKEFFTPRGLQVTVDTVKEALQQERASPLPHLHPAPNRPPAPI